MGRVQASFGGSFSPPSNPQRSHTIKMQWIIGVMFALILVLVSGVVFLVQDLQDAQTAQAVVPPPPPPAPEIPTVRMLVPKGNIAEGAELTHTMFTEKRIPEDLAPGGVMTSDDLVRLEGKFARDPMEAGRLVPLSSLSVDRPVTAFHIPAGFRAVTIVADKKTSVEGFVKPGSLVDVLWVYQDELEPQKKRIATIVRFVRVLSVAGETYSRDERAKLNQDSFTVSVLATEKDAKAIQLAASMGLITLSLVGDNENTNQSAEQEKSTDIVSIADVLKKEKVAERPKVTSKDPKTGKQQNYLFRDGNWVLAEENPKSESSSKSERPNEELPYRDRN